MTAEWFAGRLRELRTEAQLSREDLAEKAGIKASAVRDIEQGLYSPNWETVLALCRALNVKCDAFMQPPEPTPKPGPGRPKKTSGEG